MSKSGKHPARKPKSAKAKHAPTPKARGSKEPKAQAPRPDRPRDPRLPKAGTVLQRAWHGKVLEIGIGERDFTCSGKTYPSLSALARAVTGATSINGFLWAGLAPRPATRSAKAASGEAKSS